MNMKVKPYDDIIFKKCFYNPYFTGVIYCGGSILPFLSKEIYWYNYDATKPYCLDVCEYQAGCSPLEIAEEQGIKLIQQDGIKNFRSILDRGELLLAPMDRFLWTDLEVNEHFYRKQHMTHYMLIYGYEETWLKVIDLDISRNRCYEYIIEEKEFMDCYKSSLREFPHLHSYIYMGKTLEEKVLDVKACKECFANHYQLNYHKIVESLNGYTQVIQNYKNFNISSFEQANEHPVFNVPNDYSTLIRIKKIQLYQIIQLGIENESILKLLKECIADLEILKNSNWRMVLNRQYNSKIIDKIINKLIKVQTCEHELNNHLNEIMMDYTTK